MGNELERYRAQLNLTWPQALVPGVGLGLLTTFAHLGLLVPTIAVAALTLVVLLVWRPEELSVFNSGYEAVDSRPGDYPTWYYWAPVIPPAVTFLAGFALEPLPVAPVLAGTTYGAAAMLSMTWMCRRIGGQMARVGARRARKILAEPGLDGLTRERLDAAEHHRTLLTALLGVGAVDGLRVRLWKLNEIIGTDQSDLLTGARELRRHGLVGISTIDAGDDVSRQLLELTPTGVRVLGQLGRR
ncbi:hypothetical protein [Corynebacterium halotolerans]|uniref:Uncharacterized protein n=1 Tax=Corynebacterium halotolerans YIM 70093 = DSM 44683 TaxID=1121362 RepID=M1P091_9CORY|nr:hypothetical protein [Corynebacterium halotolerans]AGF73195.1 hypothetical protein A605_10975 [Corynebacterium halotolerans YIM 70093 = DSM 44683]